MISTERKKMILYSYTAPPGLWLGLQEKNVEDKIREYREHGNVTGVFGTLGDDSYYQLHSVKDLEILMSAVINNGIPEIKSITEEELIASFIVSAPTQSREAPAESCIESVSVPEETPPDEEEAFEEDEEEDVLMDGEYRCAWCKAIFTDRDLEDPNCPAVVDYNGKDFCCFDHVSEFMFNGYAP